MGEEAARGLGVVLAVDGDGDSLDSSSCDEPYTESEQLSDVSEQLPPILLARRANSLAFSKRLVDLFVSGLILDILDLQ